VNIDTTFGGRVWKTACFSDDIRGERNAGQWWPSKMGKAMKECAWRWAVQVMVVAILIAQSVAQGPWDWKVNDEAKSQRLENVTVSVIVTNDSSNAVVVRMLDAQGQQVGADTVVPANTTSGSIAIPSNCTAWCVNSAGASSGTYKNG
jgi:hypothetical protein